MKYRKWVCVEDPDLRQNKQEDIALLIQIQKAVLFSLEKRNLLTVQQRDCALVELEKQNQKTQKQKKEDCPCQ